MLKFIKLNLLILLLVIYCITIKADTKILRNFSVALKNSLHTQDISLDNENNVKAEGIIIQKFTTANDPGHVLKLNINYIADKDGYKPKIVWIKEELVDIPRLAHSTLKTIAG